MIATTFGCGRVGYDAVPSPISDGTFDGSPEFDASLGRDGAIVDGSTRDAFIDQDASTGPDASTCTFGSFSTPARLAVLSSPQNDWGPSLSSDGLTLYFGSDRNAGNIDVWFATRADPSSAFTAPSPLVALNSSGLDDDPEISADGLTIYFETDRTNPSEDGIWFATRPNPSSTFTNLAPLEPGLLTEQHRGASITADSLELYVTVQNDIAVMTRVSTAASFGAPVLLSSINTASQEVWPGISADGLTLYFGSDRPGGSGDVDLWVATRPNRSSSFVVTQNLADLNTGFVDSDPFISRDGSTLVWTSNGPGGAGLFDLWMATRPCIP